MQEESTSIILINLTFFMLYYIDLNYIDISSHQYTKSNKNIVVIPY